MSFENEPLNFFNDHPHDEQENLSEKSKNNDATVSSVASAGLTINKIIEKFIPIIGALFLTIGFGYLIYTNAWVNLPFTGRLGLGFFFSIAIIGGSFSLSEKLRYFTDIGIGSGVLLLYGTLIYGSRTTDLAVAAIPEVATLFTAFLFIIAVSYFASKRNSKVIIMLGMMGSYITPFVIGQNDVWVQNISFNAYLLYFAAINLAVFLLGREISVRNIIPLNILGLFIGTSTLYHLSYSADINKISSQDFFTSEIFTALLLFILVVFSTWSILVSAQKFKEKDDGYLALGYVAPVIWFAYNIGKLETLASITKGIFFALLAVSCFIGWHLLIKSKTRFQHIALYAAGLLSSVFAFFAFLPDLDIYSSIVIAYLSLVFGIIYVLNPSKKERLVSYGIVSTMGSFLSLVHIMDAEVLSYQTLYIVVALFPAMCGHFIAKRGEKGPLSSIISYLSLIAFIISLMFVIGDVIEYVDLNFLLFYIGPLLVLLFLFFFERKSQNQETHDVKSNLMRIALFWFALGFISIFLTLVSKIYPAPSNIFIFTHLDKPIDWLLVKGIFATIILFLGLLISRRLQSEQTEKRPSFILVIFGYATLLLTGNYIIYALMNDLQVSMMHGGPRAIVTTIWWLIIALWMLVVGIKFGVRHHAEKLLGLILLAVTVGKILLYDLSLMGMQNKVFILMIVGAALLLFSYGVQSRGWLKDREN